MIFRITYDGEGHKVALPVKNREELMAWRNSPENLKQLAAFNAGDEKAKAKLLQLAYNAWPVDGVLAGCRHISSTFFHDIDCYDAQQSEEIKARVIANKEALKLLMLERSASGGWHLVCWREPGRTILECQVRVACMLKTEMDTSAHDLQRVVFSTSGSEEDLPYLDDAIFEEKMSEEESAAEYQRLKERERKRQEDVPKGAKKANKHYRPWEEAGGTQGDPQGASGVAQSPDVVQGAGVTAAEATARTMYIFDACMKEAGLRQADLVEVGGRHDSLKSILSVGAMQLLSQEEMIGVLKVRMPKNWQDDNIQRLVSDFYANYYSPSQKFNTFQRQVYAQSRRYVVTADEDTPTDLAADHEETFCEAADAMSLSRIFASKEPPKMTGRLPKLIRLLTSKTPDIYKPTVAHAVFPPLGTHLCGVEFPYTDNVLHEATLMNVAMAGTAGGKGCVDAPIKHIMADIRERDKENERREREFNRENNRKGANQTKLTRPDDLVIQEIHNDVTHAAFVNRLDEAQGHFLYFKLNEIDMFDKLKSSGGQQFYIICQAFDPDNRYGQTRIGPQSVSATVRIRFNWNACGTIEAVQDYFSKVLIKGPVSRINFCTIPERECGADQPVYGVYDEKFDQELKPYIHNLVNTRGVIVCKPAIRLAKSLIQECAEFSRLSQDRVFENLSFRANVIAYLKACVLYVANGCKWEKTIDEFIRWSLFYDLWCKMTFFADGIRQASQRRATSQRGPRNLLALLPDEFSYEDAVRVRQQNGKDREGTGNMLSQWVYRNYVLRITDYSFKKLQYKTENNGEKNHGQEDETL